MKKSLMKIPFLMMSLLLIASCGETKNSVSSSSVQENSSSKGDDGFSFVHPDQSSEASSSSSSTSHELVAYELAVITENRTIENPYLVEAEDCDTSNCTLQAGCGDFFEQPEAKYPTSGGECLACIDAPSLIAFKINVKGTCDLTFYTVSAKYESNYSLDSNVQYYLDENTPFVTDFASFGGTDTNQWYNWKEVELGTNTGVTAGMHQFNIKVNGQFCNTDCFKIVVSNFVAAEAA
ncbi:MAG: hypothetical protein WCS80_04670 [Bacilli bacterium]